MSHRRDADVVKAVLLLGTGWTEHDVAEALLLDEKTVARYVERYRQDRRGEFWRMDYQGSSPKLNERQLAQLDRHLQECVYLTVAAIVSHVERHFGVSYSEAGMTELLHRLGFSYKKPKADAAAQMAFVKAYEKLKNASNRAIRSILWMVYIPSTTAFRPMAGSKKERPKRCPAIPDGSG